MNDEPILIRDPQVMHGEPCFEGTRVTAQALFDHLEAGYTIDGFLEQFPTVRRDQVLRLLHDLREDVVAIAVSKNRAMNIAAEFLSAIANAFEANKRLADRAVEQVRDDLLHVALDVDTNSIAVIMKHVAGNLRSRWTDFLTTDGEKPWRNRDDEFVDSFRSRQEVLDAWEAGWNCLMTTLQNLTAPDLAKSVTIRGEPHSVPLALERSLGHTCYHVGQIVQTARIHAGDKWNTLTIPSGGSEQFNAAHWGERGKSHS